MRKRLMLLALVTTFAALASGQGIPIKGGATSDLASVDTNKNVRTSVGASSRPTYIASVSGQACSAAVTLSIESSAGTGFKLAKVCANTTQATAGTGVTVTVQRRTTASSSGTALTAEGTGTTSVSKMDPSDGNYGGVARLGGTPGTGGAVLDQWAYTTGEIGTGAETQPSYTFCKTYGDAGEKMPTISAGTANGASIVVSSAGAGALAFCSVSATIISE